MNSFLFAALFSVQPFLTSPMPRLHSSGPGFERSVKTSPKSIRLKRTIRRTIPLKIQVFAARSLTIDLLVTCNRDQVMITFSRIDKRFCAPTQKCFKTLSLAVRPYCSHSPKRRGR